MEITHSLRAIVLDFPPSSLAPKTPLSNNPFFILKSGRENKHPPSPNQSKGREKTVPVIGAIQIASGAGAHAQRLATTIARTATLKSPPPLSEDFAAGEFFCAPVARRSSTDFCTRDDGQHDELKAKVNARGSASENLRAKSKVIGRNFQCLISNFTPFFGGGRETRNLRIFPL